MYGDDVVRIERLENGYEVSVIDEKIQENNRKPKSCYEDPWRSYAFENAAGVVKFLESVLDKISKPPKADAVFGEAFKAATTGEEE